MWSVSVVGVAGEAIAVGLEDSGLCLPACCGWRATSTIAGLPPEQGRTPDAAA
jgi:hypothetical protein